MSNNALDRLRMEQYCKGAWLKQENEAQAEEKAAMESNPLEKMARQIRERDQAAEIEKHRKPDPTAADIGCIKLMRDWQNKYYHS